MTAERGNDRTVSQPKAVPTPSCMKSRAATARSAEPTGVPSVPAARRGEPGPADPARGAPDQAVTATQLAAAGAATAGSGRANVRAAIHAALCGVRLSMRDRQFLGRLVNWDKRNAVSVASLLWRAREAGREEAGLSPEQREIVLAALTDAAIYRASGRASAFCWECEIVPGSKCQEHTGDGERALAYTQVARMLAAQAAPPGAADGDARGKEAPGSAVNVVPGSAVNAAPDLSSLADYRRRTQVAS